METLARAVHHAHEQHVTHGALSPANVFLTADGASRASRRTAEASWTTRAEVDRRDRMDAAQSGKAADAVEVDSTGLDLDEVVSVIVGLVPKYLQKSR